MKQKYSAEIQEKIMLLKNKNEISTNRIIGFFSMLRWIYGILFYLLLRVSSKRTDIVFLHEISMILIFQIPLLADFLLLPTKFKTRKSFKYFSIFCNLAANFLYCSFIVYDRSFIVFFIIPLMISSLYGDRKFLFTACISTILANIFTVVFSTKFASISDLMSWNFAGFSTDGNLVLSNKFAEKNALTRTIIPYTILEILISLAADAVSEFYFKKNISALILDFENHKYEKDLFIASKIQEGVLKKEFPQRPDIEIFAKMKSAKTVGGDFYDFVEIDENHVVIVIGDVSGKGLPAAMFMMNLKNLISVYANENLPPDKIFEKTNKTLCAENQQKMHSTAWLGILNTTTGELRFANAGHNPPVLMRNAQNFSPEINAEFLRTKPNFILGRKSSIKYREFSTILNEGDGIFLYTDGLNEAQDEDGNQFGYEKLLQMIKSGKNYSCREITEKAFDSVEKFRKDAEQSDDLTVLCLIFREKQKPAEYKQLTLNASPENHDKFLQFINEYFSGDESAKKKISQFSVCFSEIFSNVALHAKCLDENQEKQVSLKLYSGLKNITMIFEDNCAPFNPLQQERPVAQGKPDERQAGGLGIFIVRKLMDKVEYKYSGGKNIITITCEK